MTIRPDIIFGINANRAFTDIGDREEAMENLGLNLDDLDIIRGASTEGQVSRSDFQALANLNTPLYRYVYRLLGEVRQYERIIEDSSGVDRSLRGNLEINGALAASSVKYSYLDQDSATIQKADVSTSRVSSWSSAVSPPEPDSPIFYGGDLAVGGTITASNLSFSQSATQVLFPDSEVPTHTISATVNGSPILFYAMRGIPIVFSGFFRNADISVGLVNPGAISFRIVNLQDQDFNREYENVGGASTRSANLIYRDTRAFPKDIEIYHDPSNIGELNLFRIGIDKFPSSIMMPNLQELRISRNSIRDFPDFAMIAPAMRYLDVRENPFGSSDDATIRSFNQSVVDRIPASVETLLMGNTFPGSISGDLRTSLPNLTTLDIRSHNRGGSRTIFSPDSDGPAGELPEVPDSLVSYSASYNNFKSIPDSVKLLPDLEVFNIYGNDITDRDFAIASSAIRTVNTGGGNQINVADMRGKNNLTTYVSRQNGTRSLGGDDTHALSTPSGAYKFDGCSALSNIDFHNSYFTGPLPRFRNNASLRTVNLRFTRISGGLSESDQEYVIYDQMFDDCLETLDFFRLESPRLLAKPIHPEAFLGLSKITYLHIASGGNGVTGSIPNLSEMVNLRTLHLYQNQLTGGVPTFVQNPLLRTVNLSNNNLTGPFPVIEHRAMTYLNLNSNSLVEFNGLIIPTLRRLYLSGNAIVGSIPNLSNLTELRNLTLDSNNFSRYSRGSFETLIRIVGIDVSNNSGLSENDINLIIDDLYKNYQANPRRNVVVNIRNTAIPTGDAVDKIEFLRFNGWNIRD